MLNFIHKYLFVASSIAPVLLTLAFMAWVKPPKPETNYALTVIVMLITTAILLIVSFSWIYFHIKKDLPNPTKLSINSIAPANREVTEYFLTYLFPIIGSDALISDWRVTVFFCVSIFIYMGFSSSYHFNPIIPLVFRYKLYSAEDTSGRTISLLSKEELRRGNHQNLKVKEITTYMYIIEEITDE